MPELTLYSDAELASPYVMSVAVALAEKRVPYSLAVVDLEAGENAAPEYQALSLTGRVPTLVRDGFALSESSAICEYLDELYPPPAHAPLFPAQVEQRACARQIQAWLRSDFGAIRLERNTTVIFFGAKMPALSPAAEAAAAKLIAAAERLIPHDAADLFGEWCIADTDLALMLNRLVLHGDAVPPKLVRYAQRQWQRPPVADWLARGRKPLRRAI